MNDTNDSSEDFYAGVRNACALILRRDTDAGLKIIEDLQRQRPDSAEVPYLLGLVAVTMDEYGKALVLLEEAHDRDPECYEYSEVLANLHVRVGNLNEGVYFAKLSTTLEPHEHVFDLIPMDMTNFFESLENAAAPRHYVFGYVKLCKSEFDDAIREFDRQLALDEYHAHAHRDISVAYLATGQFERAIHHVQRAVELAPDDSSAHFRAAQVSKRIGAHEPALYHFKRIFSCEDLSLEIASASYALVCALPNVSAEELAEMKSVLDRLADETESLPDEARTTSVRKERIHVCYVVNDSWQYDTASRLEPILQLHDRSKFEVYLYQQNQGRSSFIQQLTNRADVERKLWEVDNEVASILINGDEIDVLVNTCAPETDNRATLFAMAPSAIQVGFHGGNFGLGIPGITHVLTDPSTASCFQEQLGEGQELISVEPGLWAMHPSYMLPDLTDPPATKNGFVTFGAHCDPESFTEETAAHFAEVLKGTADSRLLFGASGAYDTYPGRRMKELMDRFDVSDRIEFWPDKGIGEKWLANPNFWNDIDLFLVPGPLTAPMRAADALWMGVPVLTLTGKRASERMATSILASAAHMEWTRTDAAEWYELVAELARDADELKSIRASLRGKLQSTALFNPVAQVRRLEDLYSNLVAARQG